MAQTGWDARWGTEGKSEYWQTPARSVLRFLETCGPAEGKRVLDLGCGVGRHAFAFAEKGYGVLALDESQTAIDTLRAAAGEYGLLIDTLVSDYFHAGLDPDSFDIIVSYNVLYHGDYAFFMRSVDLCRRILKKGGKLFFTCPTRRDGKYGNGEKVADHTYRCQNSLHPGDTHYFADEKTLMGVLDGFSLLSLHREEHEWDHGGATQFSSSWEVIAQKI